MYWFLPNETGHYGSNGFAIDTINRNARTASKHDSRWDFQDYCRSTLRRWYTLMLLTSPLSNVWWFIYSHCYNKFKGQRFICKLGFSPLASIYIYWNFRAKRTIMLCSLSCYDPFFAASRVLLLSKPSGTFCVVFCRLMLRFVIVIIFVGSWL